MISGSFPKATPPAGLQNQSGAGYWHPSGWACVCPAWALSYGVKVFCTLSGKLPQMGVIINETF